ncbi:MAG: hypothetical protein GWP27_08705 [Bacteroidetes bacterium]|nr:hypothetical protein [Bacteroidota bacterium]
MLVLNPRFMLDVGFQLSYVAVAGIILIHPQVYGLWKPKWFVLDKLWSLTAVSIAAQVATFPLGIYYFHQFPNYFLLSNWIVIPAVSVILPMGMLMISFAWLPEVYVFIELIVYTCIRWLGKLISWISELPMSTVSQLEISMIELLVIYAIISSLVAFFFTRRFKMVLIALGLGCILQTSRLSESVRNTNQNLMTMYSAPGLDVMDFVRGRSIVSYMESESTSEKQIQYHISPFRSALNATVVNDSSSLQTVCIQNGLFVLNLKDSLEILSEMKAVDILHIQARTIQRVDQILALTEPEVVVLSPNLEWKVRSYWKSKCNKLGYVCHDSKNDGAYVRET